MRDGHGQQLRVWAAVGGNVCCYRMPESEGENCKAWALAQRCKRLQKALLPRGNPSPAGRAPETLLLMAHGVSRPRARVCTTLGGTARWGCFWLIGTAAGKLNAFAKYVLQYLDSGSEIAKRLGLLIRGRNM